MSEDPCPFHICFLNCNGCHTAQNATKQEKSEAKCLSYSTFAAQQRQAKTYEIFDELIYSESLNEKESSVINLRFFQNKSIREICLILKRSSDRVRQIEYKAIRKLRSQHCLKKLKECSCCPW